MKKHTNFFLKIHLNIALRKKRTSGLWPPCLYWHELEGIGSEVEFCWTSRYFYVHLTLLLPFVGRVSLLSWLLLLSIWQHSAGTVALLKQMENFSGNLARSLPHLKRDSRRYSRCTESILPLYTIITLDIGKKYILLSLLCLLALSLCRLKRPNILEWRKIWP